mmetsp:Transcript_5462/g.13745  ORF Transcript_5462/g.13745 Transcript_5462/m.13745 type:complete len:221 (-) Transcript_5462:25-687(-)
MASAAPAPFWAAIRPSVALKATVPSLAIDTPGTTGSACDVARAAFVAFSDSSRPSTWAFQCLTSFFASAALSISSRRTLSRSSTCSSASCALFSAAASASDRSSGQVFASSAPSAASARFVAAANSSERSAGHAGQSFCFCCFLGFFSFFFLFFGSSAAARTAATAATSHSPRMLRFGFFGAPSWICTLRCGAATRRRRRASCAAAAIPRGPFRAALPGE